MASGFKYFMTVIGIIAITGYIIQVRYVSVIYFEYKVENHYFIHGPIVMPMPRLDVCINLVDALNRKKLLNDLNMDMKRFYDPGFDYDEYLNQLKQLTVKQMFQYTPSVDEILDPNGDACTIRFPYLYAMKSFPDSVCSQFVLNVSKYLHRQQVCYDFEIMTPDQLKAVYPGGKMPQLAIQEYTASPDKTYLIYGISLNQELFPSLTSVNVYIERPGSSQLQSSLYSVVFPVDSFVSPPIEGTEHSEDGDKEGESVNSNREETPVDGDREEKPGEKREEKSEDVATKSGAQKAPRKLAHLKVNPKQVSSNRLPPPYFTRCTNIPGFKTVAEYIMYTVGRKSIQGFGIIPPFGIMNDSTLDLKVLSILNLRDITFMKKFSQIVKDIKPDIIECHVSVTWTYGSQSAQDNKLSVSIMWPKGVDVHAEFVPCQLISEYIIFMFSCSGFWFGTSFLTIWSDLTSIKNFYTKNRKVAPFSRSQVENEDRIGHEPSTIVLSRRMMRRSGLMSKEIDQMKVKLMEQDIEQDILWQQMNQLRSEVRTHGAFINTVVSKAKLLQSHTRIF